MKEFIKYTYKILTSFCSDFMLVPKYELGVSNESTEDIYNVYAIGDTDDNGVDFFKLRTRYYFVSLEDKENFLFCYFESQVYLSPNANPFATDKKFVEMVLQQHDRFALDCLNGKEIDSKLFPNFALNIQINNINYSKHADVIMKWMKGE